MFLKGYFIYVQIHCENAKKQIATTFYAPAPFHQSIYQSSPVQSSIYVFGCEKSIVIFFVAWLAYVAGVQCSLFNRFEQITGVVDADEFV